MMYLDIKTSTKVKELFEEYTQHKKTVILQHVVNAINALSWIPLNHGPIMYHPDVTVGSGHEHHSDQKQISWLERENNQ